ncbi:hypothetical protein SNEBB_001924 [Seison nebaliae]|nr:hypothetical protein SNEBB_001924 [Seison nebaliae]
MSKTISFLRIILILFFTALIVGIAIGVMYVTLSSESNKKKDPKLSNSTDNKIQLHRKKTERGNLTENYLNRSLRKQNSRSDEINLSISSQTKNNFQEDGDNSWEQDRKPERSSFPYTSTHTTVQNDVDRYMSHSTTPMREWSTTDVLSSTTMTTLKDLQNLFTSRTTTTIPQFTTLISPSQPTTTLMSLTPTTTTFMPDTTTKTFIPNTTITTLILGTTTLMPIPLRATTTASVSETTTLLPTHTITLLSETTTILPTTTTLLPETTTPTALPLPGTTTTLLSQTTTILPTTTALTSTITLLSETTTILPPTTTLTSTITLLPTTTTILSTTTTILPTTTTLLPETTTPMAMPLSGTTTTLTSTIILLSETTTILPTTTTLLSETTTPMAMPLSGMTTTLLSQTTTMLPTTTTLTSTITLLSETTTILPTTISLLPEKTMLLPKAATLRPTTTTLIPSLLSRTLIPTATTIKWNSSEFLTITENDTESNFGSGSIELNPNITSTLKITTTSSVLSYNANNSVMNPIIFQTSTTTHPSVSSTFPISFNKTSPMMTTTLINISNITTTTTTTTLPRHVNDTSKNYSDYETFTEDELYHNDNFTFYGNNNSVPSTIMDGNINMSTNADKYRLTTSIPERNETLDENSISLDFNYLNETELKEIDQFTSNSTLLSHNNLNEVIDFGQMKNIFPNNSQHDEKIIQNNSDIIQTTTIPSTSNVMNTSQLFSSTTSSTTTPKATPAFINQMNGSTSFINKLKDELANPELPKMKFPEIESPFETKMDGFNFLNATQNGLLFDSQVDFTDKDWFDDFI